MIFTNINVYLLISVIVAGMTVPLMQVSFNNSIGIPKVSDNTVHSSENVDSNNVTIVGNTVYTIPP
ncbi:hypothetical protein [Leuconostoc miyukkimchii]|uniref:hypothetical protein n=1 Tax=Leuconostoc miyukkimchii TaxID=910540 RepID=UPI001C7CE7BA|nr:hypothetical protein [Leuconostoc miyukkimchii]